MSGRQEPPESTAMTSEEQAGRDMTAVVAEGDGRHRDNDEAMATLAEPIDAAPTEPAAPAPLGDPGGLPTEATTAGAEDQQPSKIREPIILPTWSAFRHHFGEEVGSVGELPLRLLFRVYCDLSTKIRWRAVQVVSKGLRTGHTIYAIEGYFTRKRKGRRAGSSTPQKRARPEEEQQQGTEEQGGAAAAVEPPPAPRQETLSLVYPLSYDDGLSAARLLDLMACAAAMTDPPGLAPLILALCNEQEIIYEEVREGLCAASEQQKMKKSRIRVR